MPRLAILLMGACLGACATASPSPQASQSYADFLIGRFANLREDHAVASDRYYAALQKAPRDTALVEGGARAALATGDLRRAREIVRGAGNLDAPAIRLVRSADALSAGRWSAARASLDQMQGDVGEEFAARFLSLWSKAGEGHIDDAVADATRLSAPRPFSGSFVYQQALALDMAGRDLEAHAAYTRAEGEGLFLPPGIVRHADLLVRMGRREEAIALLQRAAGENHNSEIEAALAALQAGRPLGLAAITPASGAAMGLYGFGALLAQESDPEDGLVILSLSLMLDPSLDAGHLAFAEAQRDMGHNDAARQTLSNISAASPYAETSRLMAAWILRGEDKEDEAIAAAQAAAQTGGPRAKVALADLYRSFERYADAEPLYSELIANGSEEWRLYFARGAARERLGRWPEGEADLRRALELSPDQPDVLNYLGYTWIDKGEHLHEGMQLIQRAAELRPQSGAILDSLGWAHYRLGDYDEAITYLERAVELEPADPILNDHLGDAYWRVGRHLEARFQWRRVLTLNPETEARATAERKITAGLPNAAPLADARR